MKYPKLKNALLCRILTYVVVIAISYLPTAIVFLIKPIPEGIKILTFIGCSVALLIYIFSNFEILMAQDKILACLHCHNNARTQFDLNKGFSKRKAKKKISRFGKEYSPSAISPKPEILRYKLCNPVTIYTSGIEKVLLSYDAEYLDKSLFDMIRASAYQNSNALIRKKKPLFLDKNQKTSPLNRVTVVFIFARRIDEKMRKNLYKTVCYSNGDGDEISFLPCIIDLENSICVFNSLGEPYLGFGYPAVNRGIRLIKKIIFNGTLPLSKNEYLLNSMEDIDIEQSLWHHWKNLKKEFKTEKKKDNKRFGAMSHGEVIRDDCCIYIKWEERGALFGYVICEETKTAKVTLDGYWYYPKHNPIAKKTLVEFKKLVTAYFQDLGYAVSFISFDD